MNKRIQQDSYIAKLVRSICAIVICALCFMYNMEPTIAAGASLTGPGTVRAGDTITLKFNVNDSGKYGVEASLAYDSSVVTLSSSTISLKGWKLETNGNSLIMYDDAMTNPISGNKTVVTLVFKVKSGVATGTKVNISVNNIVATDGSNESNLGNATYSASIAAPLSTNANLSSLAVDGATLKPGFAAGTTSYDIGEVEFSTSKLNISYKAEDAKAKVSVSGNNLSVGKNTVSVTVTAESGAKKTYKITVTRKQDPNYVASSDATLSSLTVSAGQISPVFSKSTKDYVVYLPYESVGATYTATGTMSDAKATGASQGSIVLEQGNNTIIVTGTAEDGTTMEYKITVVVMPKYEGTVPGISGEKESETPSEEPTTEEPTTKDPDNQPQSQPESTGDIDDDNSNDAGGFDIVIMIVVGIVAFGVGFACRYVLFKANVLK